MPKIFRLKSTDLEKKPAIRAGNAYLTGRFYRDITIGTNALRTLTTSGDWDVFVAKYDRNGTPSWAIRAGGINDEEGVCVAVDGNANVIVAGMFTDSTTFGTTR